MVCKIEINNQRLQIILFCESTMSSQYAYVWCLFGGDRYLPGVLTSVYSISKTESKYDRVVMCTSDVSQGARETISRLAKVVEVPYIEARCKPLFTQKQREKYSTWISKSFTKWNCLLLTQYEKVLLLDADTIAVHNVDELFSLDTPSGPFNDAWVFPYGKKRNVYGGYFRHGEVVPSHLIEKAFQEQGHVATASTVLLSPSKNDFETLISLLRTKQPYGSKVHSGYDEQLIAELYLSAPSSSRSSAPSSSLSSAPSSQWHNISAAYNYIPWKHNLSKNEIPRILHYFNVDKPWDMKRDEWPDLKEWYSLADECQEKIGVKFFKSS